MQVVLPSGVLARAALVMALAKTASAFSALPPTSPLRPNLASSGLRPRASVSMGPNGAQMSLTAAKKGMLVALGQKKAAAPPTLMEQATSTVSALAATSTTTFAAVSAALLASAQGLPLLLATSALVSLIGFVRYSWFFSIGYGLSMSVMALLCMAHFSAAGTVSMIALLHSSLVLAWGVRLATFLAYREFVAWPDAKKRNAEVTKKMSLSSKAATWAGVTLFDALLFSPVLFVFKTPTKLLSVAYAGIAMQVVGLLLEAVADQQKSEHRRKTNTHVSGGLYAFSRHPNYLGEIIFWAGTYVVAVGSLTGVLQWVSATLGLVAILGVMTGATNGLDKRQVTKYMGTAGFEAYLQSTPKLVPFTGGDDMVAVKEVIEEAEKEIEESKEKKTKAATPITSTYTKNKNAWDV